ncbi:MAG: DUF1570 domain-containing protein [Deltaproteobacteria bacterium]|nr:MAG: DUF1570 domain-containing protein [Deltaproteobacteria bacterium]
MRVGRWPISLVWLVACGPAIPTLPSRGGAAWLEVTSEHFTLWTDAPAERGRELVREMERRRQVVMTAMNHAPSKARSFVIALRSEREVAAYVPEPFAAVAWDAQNPTGQPGMLLAADDDDREHVVNHELTHVISHAIIRNQPHWLSEGIATYFEMADLKSDKTSVEIGLPRADLATILQQQSPVHAAALFRCDESRCMDHRFYATSWALFSFLLNERYGQLGRYLARLNEPSEDRRGKAWAEVFPDLPLDKLDDALLAWLRTGKVRLPRIDVTVHDVSTGERPLGDGDVLGARCLLDFKFKDEATAMRTISETLLVDRTNLLARLIDTAYTHSIEPDDARATAEAHPDDWRAWRLLVFALKRGPEADRAMDRACALSRNEAPECDRLPE